MSAEAVIYPVLSITIFFEAFILVTLLSEPARKARGRLAAASSVRNLPTVAVIVPCYNEERTIAGTCESLLALDYPEEKLEIILVDDGSTDGTPGAMARYAGNPRVRIIRKENGGKHTALNAGIAVTDAKFIGCLDADSFVEAGALREVVPAFDDPKVAAVTAAMSIHKPKNILEHMQSAEYLLGITLRHALATVNGIYVTPGPFSFYRHTAIKKHGGFRHGYQTEDMEMALRLQDAGYVIENAPRARVYTKGPRTVRMLLKQRTRWTTGFFRNILNEYRHMIGNPRHGALGTLVLPFMLIGSAGGIAIFCLGVAKLFISTATAVSVRAGIPLSYAYLPHNVSFDWFYFPTSLVLLLGAVLVSISFVLIMLGKRFSRTPVRLGPGMLYYTFIYGILASLWLIRSTADVALRKNRAWR